MGDKVVWAKEPQREEAIDGRKAVTARYSASCSEGRFPRKWCPSTDSRAANRSRKTSTEN